MNRTIIDSKVYQSKNRYITIIFHWPKLDHLFSNPSRHSLPRKSLEEKRTATDIRNT